MNHGNILTGHDPRFKEYHCPECKHFIARGILRRSKLICPKCGKLITLTDEPETVHYSEIES
jgi:uncharacterized Zn finger protein (UPF0148 family)